MKRLLNVLYISTQGAYAHLEGETVSVKLGDRDLIRVPAHTLEGVVTFGRVTMSHPLMGYCCEKQITVSFLSETGSFWASLRGEVTGNILLRRKQHRVADQPHVAAGIAQTIILAKIVNQRMVLVRAQRERSQPSERIASAVQDCASIVERLERQDLELATLRGIEGEAARAYFSAFDEMIVQQKDCFRFHGRSKRPPLDAVNALLSFLYTLLAHDVRSALEGVGLDPYAGFLHADRPGRPSLALDLMEEFRAVFADRLALSLINRRQVGERHFQSMESGAVLLNQDGRRVVLEAWQKRKQDTVTHPFLEESAPMGLFAHLQSLLFARYLRGDLDAYPALVWKG